MARKDLPLIRFYDQDFVDVYEQSWNRIDSAVIKGTAENGFAKEFFVYEPSGVINQTEAIFSTFFLVYSNGSYNSSSCLDNFYAKQEADGAIRGVYSLEDGRPILTEENPEGVLPPLFSYAELNIYHKVGNKKRLKDVIEILCRYYDWLEEKFLAPNGLYAVTPLAGGRNCPLRADAFYPVDFNCQQAVNALYLSAIGELLNDRDIGFKYKKKYFSLKTRINEKMWDEEAGFYFDLKKDGSLLRVKSCAGYWAVLAELPGVDRVDRMVKLLSDENEFATEHPFPSLAACEEGFSPEGRRDLGDVNPSLVFMIIKGLEKYKYYETAREFAIRHLYFILEVLNDEESPKPDLYESYSPSEAAPAAADETGFPRRNFLPYACLSTIALMIENVVGFYISLPKKTVEWIMPSLEETGIENMLLKRNKITIYSNKSGRVGAWEIRLESDKLYYFTINILNSKKKKTLPIPSGKCSMLIDKM